MHHMTYALCVEQIVFNILYLCVFAAIRGAPPANTNQVYNIHTTSAQRLRRWSNIVYMLYKCFVFAGICLEFSVLTASSFCVHERSTWRATDSH